MSAVTPNDFPSLVYRDTKTEGWFVNMCTYIEMNQHFKIESGSKSFSYLVIQKTTALLQRIFSTFNQYFHYIQLLNYDDKLFHATLILHIYANSI